MLVVGGVRKSYREQGLRAFARRRVPVLHGVDFTVDRGEVVGLLGANGAGKSTVLHVIAGLTVADAGSVTFDGRELAWNVARRSIGMCSSADRSFYYRLTVAENLEFFGRLQGLRGDDLRARIGFALDALELRPVEHRRYAQCSTGMRQRVALARAILHDPPILLLDEPTRAIDPLHAQRFRAFVRDELARKRGMCVVLATNILEEAWSTCDRIVLLNAGRGIAFDSPAGLQQRLSQRARYRIVAEAADERFLRRLALLGPIVHGRVGGIDEIAVDIETGSEALQKLLFEISNGASSVRSLTLEAPAPDQLFAERDR